ncbi:Essential Meiotic Endonuclease [Ditylenchus destructor]|uniref:Essential Meiotic Endonuclease n=1 Tax=Ditylenchus destructor TaxID=166010 RepID=A0AAD4N2J4_9BILA|nr:Essential Meiotic Endonuclease [Ditylenchus destructor]
MDDSIQVIDLSDREEIDAAKQMLQAYSKEDEKLETFQNNFSDGSSELEEQVRTEENIECLSLESSNSSKNNKTIPINPQWSQMFQPCPGTSRDGPTQLQDGEKSDEPKRKKRTKEEIEQEKLIKEVNKVRREISAAKKSKCEKYLFCYVNNNVLQLDETMKDELTTRFAERNLSDQLVCDDTNEMRVVWKRKRVDAFLEDGKLHQFRSMDLENVFAAFLEGDSLAKLIKENKLHNYLEGQLSEMKVKNPHMTVIVLGKCPTKENVLNGALFEAYEKFRVQFRFMSNACNCSFLIVQMHRALAKMEKKAEQDPSAVPVILTEKGIREGPNLVLDWWTRMLETLHRISEEQKRALVDRYPNPFTLMDSLLTMNAGDAMYEMAQIETGNGRRIGPVIAQKIYHMLTSSDGTEILYSN